MPPVKKDSEVPLKNKVLSVVRFENDKYHCAAEDKCTHKQATFNQHNFARHIKTFHPKVYNLLELGKQVNDTGTPKNNAAIVKKTDSAMVKVTKQRIVGGLIKLVTKHRLPFNVVSYEGIHDLVDHQLKPFNMVVNNKNIPEYVDQVRKSIDELIAEEVKGKIVSIMFDMTTKRYRSVLGLNIQYYKNTELIKRTLGKLKTYSFINDKE